MINPKLVEFFKRTRKTPPYHQITFPEISPGIVVKSRIRPVPIGPLAEAHQREGLPDGIRWVFLKDLRKHSAAVSHVATVGGVARVTVRRDVVKS